MDKERQTFKKEERLKSRKLIGNLFDSGNIIHHYPYKVLFLLADDLEMKYPAKIGITVSKRSFKNAVSRNRIKRKIREAYRLNKIILYTELQKNDQKLYFFVIYTATEDLDYQIMNLELEQMLDKLMLKLRKHTHA